jgi:hypothetical protein
MGVYTSGAADIALVPGHAAKRLHRAVVQLVAPNPVWQGTAGTVLTFNSTGGTRPVVGTVVYTGTYYTEPTLYLTGSVTNPGFRNNRTGKTFSFSGVTLAGSTDLLVVDTARRTATLNGVPVLPVGNFDGFNLSPTATGGTNVIWVTATSSGTTAMLSVQYVSQFTGY